MLSCLRCAFLFASHFFNLLVFGFFFAFFFRVDPFGSQYLSPQLHCTVSGVLTEFQLVLTWFTSDNHPGLSNVHAHNAKLAAFFLTLLRSQSPVTLVNCVTGVTQIVWNPALSDHRFYSKFRCKFQLLSCLHPWRYSYFVLRKEFLPILRLNLLEFVYVRSLIPKPFVNLALSDPRIFCYLVSLLSFIVQQLSAV